MSVLNKDLTEEQQLYIAFKDSENKFARPLTVTIAPVVKSLEPMRHRQEEKINIRPIHKKIDFDFEEKVVDEELIDAISDSFKRSYEEYMKRVEEAVLNICHNFIDPPIKGEITKSKLRWRGIKCLVWREATEHEIAFVGVQQRDTLVTIDGQKLPLPDAQASAKSINDAWLEMWAYQKEKGNTNELARH